MTDQADMPVVTVHLPDPLVRLFPGALRCVDVSARTVDGILRELDGRWPGMRDRLADSRPRLRRHINVFVDGKRATLKTRLAAGSEVFVLTAMSGG